MTKLYILNGPDIGLSFKLKDGTTYVGRSLENEIQIQDQTVSRRHLKIVRRGNRFFITDLKSQNGTFFNGSIIAPGIEIQAKEGQPIALGMSVICLGRGCMEQMISLVDSIGLNRATGERSGIFLVHGDKTNQKKLELLYKVSEVLDKNLPINEVLKRILDYVFDLLKTIDRAAFILVDPDTETILDVISRSSGPAGESTLPYCPDVVRRVIDYKYLMVITDVQTEREDEIADTLKTLRIQSLICLPMINGSQIMGVMYVDSLDRPFGFAREDLSLFRDLSQRAALSIENARLAYGSTTMAAN